MIPPNLEIGGRVTSPCAVSRRYVLSHAPEVSSERCLSPHQALGLDRAGHEHPVPAPDNAWSFPATCAPSSAGQFVRRNPAGACSWHTWIGRSSDRILRDRGRRVPRSVLQRRRKFCSLFPVGDGKTNGLSIDTGWRSSNSASSAGTGTSRSSHRFGKNFRSGLDRTRTVLSFGLRSFQNRYITSCSRNPVNRNVENRALPGIACLQET